MKNILFSVVLLLASGCATKKTHYPWSLDTYNWRVYEFPGVDVPMPATLPPVELRPGCAKFTIHGEKPPLQPEVGLTGIEVTVESPNAPMDALINSALQAGGLAYHTNSPVTCVFYTFPRAWAGDESSPDRIIESSSLGLILPLHDQGSVRVAFFKANHTPVAFKDWHPERDIFTRQERELINTIVRLTRPVPSRPYPPPPDPRRPIFPSFMR